MKRILGVLLVLSLVVPAFAVTGKVFTKISGGGFAVGDTGFELNFDSFGVKYTFVVPQTWNTTWGGWINDPYDTTASVSEGSIAATLYSPGKIEVTGFKVGSLNLGAGLIVGLGADNVARFSTNATTGVTNNNYTLSYSAFAINFLPKVSLILGSINASTSDQMEFYFANLTSKAVDQDETNDVNVNKVVAKIGINVKYGAGEVGGYYKYDVITKNETSSAGVTNFSTRNTSEINSWADYLMKLNDSMDLYTKLWVKYAFYPDSMDGTDFHLVNGTTTNVNRWGTTLFVGPEAKLIYKIAGGQVKLNLGVGAVYFDRQAYVIPGTTTNLIGHLTWVSLFGVKRDDNRAVMEFGGSSKFGNWEFGMTGRLSSGYLVYYKNEEQGPWSGVGGNGYETKVADNCPWNEQLFTATIRDVYLKYSLNMVEIKFNFADVNDQGAFTDQGGLGTSAAAKWFTSVELSYKF